SVNLGIINLFPLPVLDGGYLLILLLEGITRRKFQGRSMEWIMRIGWWLFIVLMIFTFWNDIVRLIAK
ncbi:MAG: site-2 protease family protein, partial [Rickettsiales bacterium]|nr:site-2 protease family protein [Rickettsiales bacterium]